MAHFVHDLLHRGFSVIAEGNFTVASRLIVERPPCRFAQVHVTAAPEVLRERLRSRTRHPVHYDAAAADEIAARAAAGEWAVLPVDGELEEVDTTTSFPDVAALAARFVFG
jgi:ribose 1,5-bisphosphokinase PhnN